MKNLVKTLGFTNQNSNKGFTLIEILVVIGIIAILAAIVIIAINPARQFAQARNSQRTSNVNAILNAVGQNLADNKGVWTCAPEGPIDVGLRNIQDVPGGAPVAGQTDLAACLVPNYLPSMPFDPTNGVGGGAYDTKYTVQADAIGRITVCAPGGVEPAIPGSTAICVTR